MEALHSLIARDSSNEGGAGLNRTMVNLMIVLLVLVLCGLILVATLFFVRDYRRKQKSNDGLPSYSEKPTNSSNHRRLTITATPYGGRPESFHVYSEKQHLIQGSCTPPFTPEPIPRSALLSLRRRTSLAEENQAEWWLSVWERLELA